MNAYIRRITENPELRPDFNGFYEFVRDDYRRMMEKKRVREKDFDIDGFLNVLEPFYKGGDYDFLLNSDKEIDLTHKRFIVFELDNISSNKVLLPVVTLIIMETFISKMRRLKGIRKVILLEEAWKSLMSPIMAAFRRGDCRHAGGGRHHLVPDREGGHHQQLGLQDPAGPEEVPQ